MASLVGYVGKSVSYVKVWVMSLFVPAVFNPLINIWNSAIQVHS